MTFIAFLTQTYPSYAKRPTLMHLRNFLLSYRLSVVLIKRFLSVSSFIQNMKLDAYIYTPWEKMTNIIIMLISMYWKILYVIKHNNTDVYGFRSSDWRHINRWSTKRYNTSCFQNLFWKLFLIRVISIYYTLLSCLDKQTRKGFDIDKF